MFESSPESPKAWQWYDNHYELQGDGFHISYNPATSALNSGDTSGLDFSGNQGEETALCRRVNQEPVTLILNGDWRTEYEKRIDQGYEACYQFYQEQKGEHQSSWSSDYGQ